MIGSKTTILNELLTNLLERIPELLACLVVDFNGLIIVQQSVKEVDEELVGAIMSVVEQNMNKIKKYTETSIGSGSFATDEFQLFYTELGKEPPMLFVLVSDPSSNIEKYMPYSYIIAEKISQILTERETETSIPKVNEDGELIINSHAENNGINKILLIGPSEVGKSTLLGIYMNGIFEPKYKPTIGISLIQNEFPISRDVKLRNVIFDLSGLKSFGKIRRFYYKGANAVLVLFDYTRIETLENINEWIEEAKHFVKDVSIPYILIGNKIDLSEDRFLMKTMAKQLANQYKCQFFETSAFTGEGIDEVFTFLISYFCS
ncbi:MAG: GTP-binding protein [Promethearchaeota archaeon]|nr:MAG: GTP-binding protein [Candidatus Lokiarchaeota archaeon]